jgi:hypothetical protein
MQKEKSIIDWLHEIPDEKVRDLAIAHHEKCPLKVSSIKINTLPCALFNAFSWMNTPEGYTLWVDKYRELVALEENKEITIFNEDEKSNPDKEDKVNHPRHYKSHPSGVECIQVTEHLNFCLGNAIKYIWRADDKENDIEDLRKAVWYVNREIERRLKARN